MIAYHSTRGGESGKSFEDVLLAGLAADGGLYVPEFLPSLPGPVRGSYIETAQHILCPFTAGFLTAQELQITLQQIYAPPVFAAPDIAPLRPLQDNLYLLELFHGPTLAFKDFALQLLGRLFDHALRKTGKTITIIGATSGDTGSAAIEGCRHSTLTRMFMLHPHGRVSDVQRRQMTTLNAPNVYNIAIEGTFDDCQALVKALFADAYLRAQHNLAAVNSINWARIAAQIVYYFYAAQQFAEPVTFVVPTGNFGNVLAGYYARAMGAPIKDLVVASNRNDILTRFFETGAMTAQPVQPTLSPSMDIQISSNFERYLFALLQHDAQHLKTLMQQFRDEGAFRVSDALLARARQDFTALRASETETLAAMKDVYAQDKILIDPHTAVGVHAARQFQHEKNKGPVIVLATAHPAKFPDAVHRATGQSPALPASLATILQKPEKFTVLPADLTIIKNFIKEA
ncbi:MAG: threonine synthase [Alphaproteobacteria bacterium]|nr:threonine synthase [Alphaproteobacteria bacterium]